MNAADECFIDEDGAEYAGEREIGRGVLTTVVAAMGVGAATTTPFAIKTVLPLWIGHPLAEARISRERELSAAIHESKPHACCARVLSGGRQQLDAGRTRPFHVSPLYDGVTLADRLRERGEARRIPVEIALAWADDLLSALARLHEVGWVHRDVKPQNVYLVMDGARERAMLMDYGLAVRIDAPRNEVDEPFGTPAYVSPEVVAGATLDARADLYSLALIIFELLCGRRPFVLRDPIGLVEAHLGESPPSLRALCPELSPEMDGVITGTLAKSPGERPSRATELRKMLRATPEARS